MSHSEILEERGDLRVRLILDVHPNEPHDDGGSPIIRLCPGWVDWRAEHIDSITSFKPGHIDQITAAARKWGLERDLFERYMRANYGTTEIKWWDSRGNGGGDAVYVTFDTAEWRQHMGIAPGQTGVVDMAEWQAYCEGDVWGYNIERRRTWAATDDSDATMETWELVEDGDRWDLYGREYAEQSAREAFAEVAG